MTDYTTQVVKNLELLYLVNDKGLSAKCLRMLENKDKAIENLKKLEKKNTIYQKHVMRELLRNPKVADTINILSKDVISLWHLTVIDLYLEKYGADYEDTEAFAKGLVEYCKMNIRNIPDAYIAFDLKLFLYLSDTSMKDLIYSHEWRQRNFGNGIIRKQVLEGN